MRKYLSLLLMMLLGSCVGPDYERPHIPVPREWKNQPIDAEKDQRNIDLQWWKNFHDPQLNTLIEEASKTNLDYLTALARIQEARANYAGVESNFFPTISGVGSASESRFGSKASKSINSSSSTSTPSTTGVQGSNSKVFMAGFDATWELDFFGAIRRGEESAVAILESVEDNARATLLSLVAEIAQNYINLRNYQQQAEVTKEIIALWEENLKLQSSLEKTGLNSQLTTEIAKSALDQASAALSPLAANIKITLNHLGILLGKDPSALYDQLMTGGTIPRTSEVVIAGLPAELICRRPDIRANERLLASATAQIGVSMSALFPQFQLTGNYDFQRSHLKHLFSPSSQFWQYGLNFSVPIFDFGKIQAQIDAKYAQKDEALFTYQKSILTALEDVENGLVNYADESNRSEQLESQASALERNYRLTSSRYKAGLNNYLDVIQSKITFLNAKLNAIQSLATVSLNLVSLYKSLGGGWETFEPVADNENNTQLNKN